MTHLAEQEQRHLLDSICTRPRRGPRHLQLLDRLQVFSACSARLGLIETVGSSGKVIDGLTGRRRRRAVRHAKEGLARR